MTNATDRIEKSFVLRAPHARVWAAISDARQFGSWFGVEFDGEFAAGARITGRIVPTTVDAEVAKSQEPHSGTQFEFQIESVEPMRRFAFRWHPYAVDASIDYTDEPTTLVEFQLAAVGNDTRVTITESGFDRLPPNRRAEAFSRNEAGWAAQTQLLTKYLIRRS